MRLCTQGAIERLEQLGIRTTSKVRSLSGGQQAQLALTLALAKIPKLLLLDEPMSDLDPLARRNFLASILASAMENDQTVVFSSHDVADLSRSVDYLVLLAGGRIQYSGSLDDFLAEHLLVRTDPKELDDLPEIECIDRNLDTHVGEHLVRLLRPGSPSDIQGRTPTREEDVVPSKQQPSRFLFSFGCSVYSTSPNSDLDVRVLLGFSCCGHPFGHSSSCSRWRWDLRGSKRFPLLSCRRTLDSSVGWSLRWR
jgi:ABC transporter